jgi:hypothetical protein
MFSRRHYEFIAETIARLSLSEAERRKVAAEFARALKSESAAFKPERFLSFVEKKM